MTYMSGSRAGSGLLVATRWVAAILLGSLVFGCAGDPIRPDGRDAGPESLYAVELPRSGGGMVALSDYRGRVLVLDFFTTWSQPSLLSIPHYNVLDARYADRGLAMVGVAMDELGDDVVAPFAAGLQISYPVALASRGIVEGRSIFGDLSAIPTLLIFDRSGHLVQVFFGLVPIEQVEEVIRRLL